MDFSTFQFWYSLIPALLILLLGNRILRGRPGALQIFHKYLMLALSLTLLCIASVETLIIFLTVTLLAWFSCKWGLRFRMKGRTRLLCFQIPLLLLPLIFYKYSYFICGQILQQEWDTLRHLIIPIGISFYTFQIIGFCIDTLRRDQPMPKFIDYMNFGSFFPQIVAGPIERRADLLPQMQNIKPILRKEDIGKGLPYIILGLFFKLTMADNLAAVFTPGASREAFCLWLNALVFTFRIYFDFAGYGLTAYGIAKCMGVELRMNFLSPYTAVNITDFWRRWHTSLTSWFTEYIYFPLGGSRTKRWAVNILFVFLISGIWHGAGWNFMIWGLLSGVALVIHKTLRKQKWHIPAFCGWLLTFVYMVFVWMFFYDTDINRLILKMGYIFRTDAYHIGFLLAGRSYLSILTWLMIALGFIVVLLEHISRRRTGDPYALFLHPVSCGIMVMLMIIMVQPVHNDFIYFAF